VSFGGAHACALTTQGKVWCWGNNEEGQLGYNPELVMAGSNYPPYEIPTLSDVIAIDAGTNHTCALRGDGILWCWGENSVDQGGVSAPGIGNEPVPAYIGPSGVIDPPPNVMRHVTAAHNHTCVLDEAWTPYCVGSNQQGAVAGAANLPKDPMAQIHTGHSFSCAETVAGFLYCWGLNASKQLGLGDDGLGLVTDPDTKVEGGAYDQPSLGDYHACALQYGVTAPLCWGDNTGGQLGQGTDTDTNGTPTIVSWAAISQFATSVAAGSDHSCALLDDGRVVCWGKNAVGQLGNGSQATPGNTPVYVPSP
jgi:alpha-tubulin suppressor-like RCC1 family protein